MPALPISSQAYERAVQGGEHEVLLNMVPDFESSGSGQRLVLYTRPGLKLFATGYKAPMRGQPLSEDGLFGGDIFSVHGDALYRTTRDGDVTEIGSVGATGAVSLAASRGEVLVCTSPTVWSYNGETLVQVDVAGVSVSSIAQIGLRFIAAQLDSDRFYWSALLDGRDWPGLNFKTAEGNSDTIVRLWATTSAVILFGTKTVEFYAVNGSPRTEADAFYRLTTGAMRFGLIGDTVAQEASFVFWVSEKRHVYFAEDVRPAKISTRYVEDRLTAVPDDEIDGLIACSFTVGARVFYALTSPGRFTLVYCLGAQRWVDFSGLGQSDWLIGQATEAGAVVVAGRPGSADMVLIAANADSDLGKQFVQRFSITAETSERFVMEDLTVRVFADRPVTGFQRFSEDGGRSFTADDPATLPSPENPRVQAMWRGLGTVRPPSRIHQIQVTEPCRLIVRGAVVNEGVDAR